MFLFYSTVKTQFRNKFSVKYVTCSDCIPTSVSNGETHLNPICTFFLVTLTAMICNTASLLNDQKTNQNYPHFIK